MKEIELPTGAKLGVDAASFAESHRLVKAIMGAMRGGELPSEALGVDTDNLGEALKNPALLTQIVDRVLAVATSDDVEKALMACLGRCTYNGVKITPDLLDEPDVTENIREDYYKVCLEVIKANCAPFFKRTFSGLKTPAQRQAASLQ